MSEHIHPPANERELIQEARALAEEVGELPDWQAMFKLARRLRARSPADANPEAFENAVRAFCERAGKPAAEYWYTFLHCWEKVKFAEGETVFGWAAERARTNPVVQASSAWQAYAFVASLAYHLAEFRQGKSFWLPLPLIAKQLNTNPMTASRVIARLKKDGVLRCVSEEYSYKGGLAKEYEFVRLPPPKGLPQQS